MAVLMCAPDHFGVEYEINPWMHIDVGVDRTLARRQWTALRDTYVALGEKVHVVDAVPGLPDMVFTANAAVVRGREAVLSRFRHPERRGEEEHWATTLGALGLRVHRLPEDAVFEGAGDALFVGDVLVAGHGFRTDRASHTLVGNALHVEVLSVRLVDPRFYHLDTCFCVLDKNTVLLATQAVAPEDVAAIRSLVPNVIDVPPDVAVGFACNAMALRGRVVSSLAAAGLGERLSSAGYATTVLPMGEFLKSGGGVRCLSLPYEDGVLTA